MNTEETIEARQQRLASIPRACEGCRIRKIRCDRTVPCSHCRTSGIACQNSCDKPESRPRSDRIKHLESHVSRLEKRLRSLEARFANSHTAGEPRTTSPRLERSTSELEVRASPSAGENQLFEGGSSFSFQSFQASKAVEMTAESNDPRDESNIKESLDHLQSLLRESPSRYHHSFGNSALQSMPAVKLLPVALIIGILQRFKTRRPLFLSSYAVSDLAFVERLCQNVYFPMTSVTVGQLTSMHGILYFLLKEYMALKDPLCEEFDFKAHLAQCDRNLISGLETYDILAVPCFENVLALVMGAIKAQEEAKPFLYCTLISSAATHCQTLGYHREITYQQPRTESSDNIRRLFWTVYAFDKNISLLLGRASRIQDFDIDAGYPEASSDPTLRPWDESFILGIKLASLQGQIYTALYSATGLKKSLSERSADISRLSSLLEQWRIELEEINSSGVNNPQVFHLSRGNWDIMFYSTLTALFPRLSLQSHLRCLPQYQETRLLSDIDYVNFILLFSSFTPFIVTFLHAIGAHNSEDVKLLEDVLSTLQNARAASKAAERLFQICSAFVRLAKELSRPRSSPLGFYNQRNDCLRLMDTPGQSILRPGVFQPTQGQDPTDGLGPSDVFDILDDWVSGQPISMDFFDVNPEVNMFQ
ncbi:transcriptional regulator family: Fungal Specific TF [Paecilomyces variotii]|nr:transcriptional regulator family: Fungal Specific TF [Paecilomyces variotii]